MRKAFGFFLLAACICTAIVPSAKADAMYTQRFQEDGWYNGQHYQVTEFVLNMLTLGMHFQPPGADNFSGTTNVDVDLSAGNRHLLATFDATGYLQFDLHFKPGRQPPTWEFTYVAYSGQRELDPYLGTWNGANFSFTKMAGPETGVPEPVTWLMAIPSLAVFALLRRQFYWRT